MELIIAELSRYIIVIIFALYTFYSYRAFIGRAAGNNEGVFRAQRVLTVMLHLVCSAVILVEEKEIKYVVLWTLELFFFLFFTKIYQVFYKGMSKLIWNNMMICMMIGFIMLGRLSYDYAINAMREAISGLYQCDYAVFLVKLCAYAVISLILGLGIRKSLLEVREFFERRMKETHFM